MGHFWHTVLAAVQTGAPPLPPAPGSPQPWQPGDPVYSGVVHVATGNLQIVHPVCGWGGKGGGVSFVWSFNSQSGRSSALGLKWRHTFNWQVLRAGNTATVIAGDGTETVFTRSGGPYVPPAGVFARLVRNGDHPWTRTHQGGLQRYFLSDGRLDRMVDWNGNTVPCGYTNGLRTRVTDASGRVLPLGDTSGRLTRVTDAEGRLVVAVDGTGTRTFREDRWGRRVGQTAPAGTTTAVYDGAGRFVRQTDVTGRVVPYGYDGAGRLIRVSDPTSWVQYTYHADGAVVQEVYSNHTRVDDAYDSAGQVTEVWHRVHSSGAWIVGDAVVYDAAGRVVQVTESPTGGVMRYQYDGSGRLLREERTGDRPYLGEYPYDGSGNRTDARRVENGVETHRGTDPYDGAGRLVQVVDAATNQTEVYTWNADGTLSSFPGAGYVCRLAYDEEGRLVRICRDYGGGNVQVAYEYGYGFDGGRRWRKDYVNGVWTWYPCGVGCGAGELVEQTSDLSGAQWTTSGLYLRGISLVRR
ncbi:MAG: hypothetical protein C4335_03925, partial [Armatimonadota bacterium]